MPSDFDPSREPRTWLVDGFNVLHVGVLRGRVRGEWWRQTSRERLLSRTAGFDDPSAEVWVVFDGPHPPSECSGERVVFARSADEWLLRRVREAEAPDQVAVVTADRRLADRVRARGARVIAPGEFLRRCNS